MFQSTRPYGARRFKMCLHLPVLSFNPRARMGRDPVGAFNTVFDAGFNPRARMGRDCSFVAEATLSVVFQSTRPYGARHAKMTESLGNHHVSIHAPVWGATYIHVLRTHT